MEILKYIRENWWDDQTEEDYGKMLGHIKRNFGEDDIIDFMNILVLVDLLDQKFVQKIGNLL